MYTLFRPERHGVKSKTWYVSLNGKRYSTKCKDRAAAEAVARELERRASDPTYAASREYTLDAALGDFVKARKDLGRSPATIEVYLAKAGNLVRIIGSDTPLSEVDARAVDRFTATRLTELVSYRSGPRPVSRHTIAKELNVLRGCLNLAHRSGLYDRQASSVLPVGWSTGYKPRETFLTREQAAALLYHLEPERAAHLAFILATGARRIEAERAVRADVDLVAGRVRLRGSKTDDADRVVPVVEVTRYLLEVALRDAPGGEQGPMFRVWHRGSYIRDIAVACERAGVPRVSPNDLRRSLATWLIHGGVSTYLVSKILGHKDTRMVERVYGRVEADVIGRLVNEATKANKSNKDDSAISTRTERAK